MQGTYAMRIAFSVSDIAQGLLLFVNSTLDICIRYRVVVPLIVMASSDPGMADPEPEPERAAAAQEDAAASSSDEEVDRRAFGIWQALPVPMRAPAWDVEELDSVEEYLCRVRWQAQSLPGTVVAKEVPSALDRPSSAAVPTELDEPEPCHPSLLPKAEWLADFVARFRLLRDRLQW